MPFDSTAYHTETKPDLSTPRARLLYLRDVVVPRIPEGELDMSYWDCGTTACLAGWAVRDTALWQSGLRRDFCGTWPVFSRDGQAGHEARRGRWPGNRSANKTNVSAEGVTTCRQLANTAAVIAPSGGRRTAWPYSPMANSRSASSQDHGTGGCLRDTQTGNGYRSKSFQLDL